MFDMIIKLALTVKFNYLFEMTDNGSLIHFNRGLYITCEHLLFELPQGVFKVNAVLNIYTLEFVSSPLIVILLSTNACYDAINKHIYY